MCEKEKEDKEKLQKHVQSHEKAVSLSLDDDNKSKVCNTHKCYTLHSGTGRIYIRLLEGKGEGRRTQNSARQQEI